MANVFEQNRGLGRGYETMDISWIWVMHGAGIESQDNNWLSERMWFIGPILFANILLVLRVQFLDAKTTLDRWKEERELLNVEMLRTANYFRWMSVVWEQQAYASRTPGERAHACSMRLNFMELEQGVRNRIVQCI
jgi:hypothetical protein